MSDSQNPRQGRRASNAYTGLAIVFGLVGVVFFLTMDNRIMGLPFVILGLSFYAFGAGTTARGRSQDGSADDDDPGAPGAPWASGAPRPDPS
jgi:drug/metabolite transporter (DMT)-like permease